MTEPARIEPAHVIMLRAALAAKPFGTMDLAYNRRADVGWQVSSNWPENRQVALLKRWRRIVTPLVELAEAAQLPIGIVLLAMGKGM